MTAAAYPTVIVEVWLAGPTAGAALHLDDVARGKLDVATLGGESWTDISDYVHSVSVKRGANRVQGPVVRYEAGTCTIALNNADRRFDPTNLSGPYTSGGATEILPMRAVRVRAAYNAGSGDVYYDLWRGTADAWKISYDIGNTYSLCVLTGTDAFKVLAKNTRIASGAVGASEDSGARVTRILNSAGWPATDRIIATGDTTLQATTLAGGALDELQLVSDTEIGDLFVDGAGRVVFRSRHDTLEAALGTTFSDAPGHSYPYADVAVEYDDTNLANDVHITRSGGIQQTASDATSQTAYLVRTFERSGLLMETDAVADSYADFVLGIGKDPELRFASMTLTPQAEPGTLFPEALSTEIGDRIQIVRTPPGGGTITREVFVRGIEHDFTTLGSLSWTTKLALQSASRYSFLILDDATKGRLDAGNTLASY